MNCYIFQFEKSHGNQREYVELVPMSPEKPGSSKYCNSEVTSILESDEEDSFFMVQKFGDVNCLTRHAKFLNSDNFERIFVNTKHYLKKVAPMISKDEDIGWIAKIMIHWKDVNIPENINDRWNQISFTIWEILIKYNCHGCLFHEFYVKDSGIIKQERFRKIFQETYDAVNCDLLVKNIAQKKIMSSALTKL